MTQRAAPFCPLLLVSEKRCVASYFWRNNPQLLENIGRFKDMREPTADRIRWCGVFRSSGYGLTHFGFSINMTIIIFNYEPKPIMDHKPSRKEISHERIVAVTARAIRRAGYDGVGVADIMQEAGLTHGGFYAHFPSRNALLVEALEYVTQEGAALFAQMFADGKARGVSPLRALIEGYLSEDHLTGQECGCVVAALSSEMSRQSPEVREAFCARIQSLITLVQRVLPARVAPENAVVIVSTLVGSLQLARAMSDQNQGKAILETSRRALIQQYDQPEPVAATA